jgi:hypothetical protein
VNCVQVTIIVWSEMVVWKQLVGAKPSRVSYKVNNHCIMHPTNKFDVDFHWATILFSCS